MDQAGKLAGAHAFASMSVNRRYVRAAHTCGQQDRFRVVALVVGFRRACGAENIFKQGFEQLNADHGRRAAGVRRARLMKGGISRAICCPASKPIAQSWRARLQASWQRVVGHVDEGVGKTDWARQRCLGSH